MDTKKAIIPRPFAVVIDDMGWMQGSNLGEFGAQGPFRCGVRRSMNVNDYSCVSEVGKAVGVRIQGAFVLCEMDRENVCKKYPTTTWMGSAWDNTHNVSDEQIRIMEYVKKNAANLEFAFHGVGHEYWPEEGKRRRAEWYNIEDDHPWPEASLREHVQCYKEILAQYGITEKNGHTFPESFVPCAYSYYWNPEGDYSLGKILSDNGVRYANTLFSCVSELNPPAGDNGGGLDHGVLVVNRIGYGNDWFKFDALPEEDIALQESDVIEAHWPNFLAQDDFLQKTVTDKWITYYRSVQRIADRYCAKNTEQFSSQWIYKKYAVFTEDVPGKLIIDTRDVPDDFFTYGMITNLVIKIPVNGFEHVSSAKVNGGSIASICEESGFAHVYLPCLEKGISTFEYKISNEMIRDCVYNDGTYNVYGVVEKNNSMSIDLRVYGEQTVTILSDNTVKSFHRVHRLW